MRKGVVTMFASGLLAAMAWAATAESPPPGKVANAAKAAPKPVAADASLPGGKPKERKDAVVPQASGTAVKRPSPRRDNMNLGLGCAQP